MKIEQDKVSALIDLFSSRYPSWKSFRDTEFEQDQVTYKHAAIKKLLNTLDQENLARLLGEGQYDEIVAQIEELISDTKLLYIGSYYQGDHNILYSANLNKATFCDAFYDMLYGEGSVEECLTRYLEFVEENNLPSKWTFPTYFLFLRYPETEILIKPHLIRWFLNFVDADITLESTPRASVYTSIKELVHDLKEQLSAYDPRDIIDIQGFLWVAYKEVKGYSDSSSENNPEDETLASPFNLLFQSETEADQAFKLIEHAANKLGIQGKDDPRFSISLTDTNSRSELNFNYANWHILGFNYYKVNKPRVYMTLLEQQLSVDQFTIHRRFTTKEDEPEVAIYRIPAERVFPLDETIGKAFDQTLDFVKQRLEHYSRTPYRKTNVPELAQGIFDQAYRNKLFIRGLSWSNESYVGCPFSNETFKLLDDLYEHQTKDFYQKHKDEFQQYVEDPLQDLMNAVAGELPERITERMETQKEVFARIPKNDFGRGGAWDFYWGAFYPKGGKRIQDAQLFMWINRNRLEFGFYIGEGGQEKRDTFLKNVRANRQLFEYRLRDLMSAHVRVYGARDDFIGRDNGIDRDSVTIEQWLQDPLAEKIRFAKVLSAEEVLSYSFDQLREQIADTFKRLYPLVILTDDSDPREAVAQYIGEAVHDGKEIRPSYSLAECAAHTGFEHDELNRWVRAIHRKGQGILYGPPGTGKTHMAAQLAKHMIGGGDGFYEVLQFHPSYSYEDFIQGIRPESDEDGTLRYPLRKGKFLEFDDRARMCNGTCVLIIDEINRANLSRVFGELMYLLEYRQEKILLAGGRMLSIPRNVRIIGTMNTADRSIALVDHALRRRFAFLPLYPNFDVLRHYNRDTDFPVEQLITVIDRVNDQIGDRHYHIGITYFLTDNLLEQLPDIWQMEIEPYLDEYFFDQPEKADAFRWEKVRAEVFG